MNLALKLFATLILSGIPAAAQSAANTGALADGADSQSVNARLTIESQTVPFSVYDDTTLLGVTPLQNITMAPGIHILHYITLDKRSWFNLPLIDTLTVSSSSYLHRSVKPLIAYRVTSEPYDAGVRYRDSIVGYTPCILFTSDTAGIITLSKETFRNADALFSYTNHYTHVVLSPLRQTLFPSTSESLITERANNQLPIYLSTAATVITGITAAYLKMKADSYYDEYLYTGNSNALHLVHTYDTVSGIALAASEISFLTLTFILLAH